MQEMEEEIPKFQLRSIPNILITGTPGTGKTTLATLLNEALHFTYINIGKLVTEQTLYKEWDNQFNVPFFDQDLVLDYLQSQYNVNNGGLIIDFHSSDFFPLRYFDLVILVRCKNDVLYNRLLERGYNEKKISENLDCEILEVTHEEVYESYPPQIILQLRNEEKQDVEKNLQIIIEWLQNFKQRRQLQIQLQQVRDQNSNQNS